MRRTTVLAASAALSLLLTAGCSSNTPANTTAGPATSAPATVAKDKVIEEGDKLCKENAVKEKEALPASAKPSESEIETYLKKIVELRRDVLTKIKALGTPDKDADKLTLAIEKGNAVVAAVEVKIPEYSKDADAISTDTEVKKLSDEADKAAQDFGFKECGKSSGDSSSDAATTTAKSSDKSTTTEKSSDKSTTTSKSGSSSDTTKAKEYVSGLSSTITYSDEQIDCVAKNVFGDSKIAAIAVDSNTTVAQRQELFGVLVDCLGPEFLIDAFMTGVEKKNPTAEQSACIRKELEALSKTEGITLVSGDPDAVKAFADLIATKCSLS